MNLSAKGRKLLGAFGLGRSDRGARQVTDPDGGSAQYAASSGTGFSKTDEIMNTKTNKLWCMGLAVLALTCALANTALGQEIVWSNPADISYGTELTATQLNARVTQGGVDITDTGVVTYFWDQEVTDDEQKSGDARRSGASVTRNDLNATGYKPGDRRDRDDNSSNGIQPFDWLFLDAGTHTLRAVFSSGGQNVTTGISKEVQIKVNPVVLSAVPATLSRPYGEENLPGFETGKVPTYPVTGFPIFDPALNAGNRVLVLDDNTNTPITDPTNGNAIITVPVIAESSNDHYSRKNGAVIFSGFVRGENYEDLIQNKTSVATGTEINNPQTLVAKPFLISVKDADGNDIFRAAPVGTTGNISITQTPEFKNYTVSSGANGTLTVTRAEVKFEAKNFTADNAGGVLVDTDLDGVIDAPGVTANGDGNFPRKIFGDGVVGRINGDSEVNPEILKSGDFGLTRNFRLGEAFIQQLIGVNAPGLAVDSPVGDSSIDLFFDTSPLGQNVAFLDNYSVVLVDGSVTTIARKIELIAGNAVRVFGGSNPAFTFEVKNAAPHQLKVAVNGNNTHPSGDLKDNFFSVAPVLSTTAGFNATVGDHAIAISDAAAPNHVVDKRINGTLSISKANLVLQVNNASSIVNASLSTPTVTSFGLLPFDTLGSVLTANPTFALFLNGVQQTDANVKAAANGEFDIEISNKSLIRAVNYNVFFNDGLGTFDGLGDPAGGVASDDLAVTQASFLNPPHVAATGRQFVAFTGNAAGPQTNLTAGYDLNNPLFTVDPAKRIAVYSVFNRQVNVLWSTPSAVTFGDTLGNGRLNAQFINPDTGIVVTSASNGGQQLIQGTDFDVHYAVVDGGATIKSTAVNANAEKYTLLKAGTHSIRVTFELLGPGQGKVGFGTTSVTRTVTVNPVNIRVKPTDEEITFGQNVPPSNDFAFYGFNYNGDDLPPVANFTNGQLTNGNAINDTFQNREINAFDRRFTTTATNSSPAGEYPLTPSAFKAKNGNVTFTYQDAKFTVKQAGTDVSWQDSLANIEYGTPLSASQLNATGPAGIAGTITYNVQIGQILPVGAKEIEAKFTPDDSNRASSSKKLTLTVTKRPLKVGALDATKSFGDKNPSFQATADSLTTLIAGDNITLGFQTSAGEKSNVGKYPIEPVVNDPSNKLGNYELTITSATFEITKRPVTVTPANRVMGVGSNPSSVLNDFMNSNVAPQTTSERSGADTRPSHRVVFGNLASFHAIADNKFSENKADAFDRLDALFNTLNLSTTATINSPTGASFPISVASIVPSAAQVNGAKADGNYTFSLNTGTIQVDPQKATITWNPVTITYGQAVKTKDDGGVVRADKDKDSRTQAVNLFDAVVGAGDPAGGTFVYNIKDAGPLLSGTIFNAGVVEIEAVWTPPASAPRFGETRKTVKLTIAKRPLTINIEDMTSTYGSIDMAFATRVGLIRGDNGDGSFESDKDLGDRQAKSPIRLVNGDTLENLDTQLVLFSNVTPMSPAGEYFVGVAQAPEDSNYEIAPIFGNHILRDGNLPNNPSIGPNINGVGAIFSQVLENGQQLTFDDTVAAANRDTLVNFPIGANPVNLGPVEFHAAKLTVTKAQVTITANDAFHDRGAVLDRSTFSVRAGEGQLKNGDTIPGIFRSQPIFVTSVNENTAVGQFPLGVTGASSDNYIVNHRPGSVFVQLPAAAIGWTPNPSSIVYGSGLTSDQLNATSTASGTFVYDPPIGTVLPVGTQTLGVTFTPADADAALFRETTATASIVVAPAPLTVTANDIDRGFLESNPAFSASFSGFVNGDTESVLTAPVTFVTEGVNGANAGTYPLTPGNAAADNYSVSFVAGSVNISQAAAQVALSGLEQVADGNPKQVTVVTTPAGLGVNVTYNGSSELPILANTYGVRVLVNDPNYIGFAIGDMVLSATAIVNVSDLEQVFDGTPRAVAVTTEPVGLQRTITYNGSATPPVNAGTHEVRVLINDPVYSGFAVSTLTILPATAEITFDLDSLSQPVNGVTGATVNTVPAGLNAEIFYGDTTSLPTEIGSTLIRGVINEPNWVGSVTSTFRVTNATQTVTTFALPEFTIAGSPLNVGLVATASSGLPVTFSVSSGAASVSGNLLTVTQPGDIVVVASQAGDDFWAPAEASFTVSVTGQGVALEAPTLRAALGIDGIDLSVSGAAGATVRIMRTDRVPGGIFSDAGTITLDGSGNGSLTVPADGPGGYFKAANQ